MAQCFACNLYSIKAIWLNETWQSQKLTLCLPGSKTLTLFTLIGFPVSRDKCNYRYVCKIWEHKGEKAMGRGVHRKVIFGLGFEECVVICQVKRASKLSQLEKQFTQWHERARCVDCIKHVLIKHEAEGRWMMVPGTGKRGHTGRGRTWYAILRKECGHWWVFKREGPTW